MSSTIARVERNNRRALRRHDNDLLIRYVDDMRAVVRNVRSRHPFHIHAWVVLPDHLHCVLELPSGDTDFPLRWRLIKADFSKRLPITERRSAVRQRRGERGIWQRRFLRRARVARVGRNNRRALRRIQSPARMLYAQLPTRISSGWYLVFHREPAASARQ